MRIRTAGLVIVLALVCIGAAVVCCIFFRGVPGKTPAVGVVGGYTITEQDIELRTRVAAFYYPEAGRSEIALSQLIRGYLSAEIMAMLGHPITGEMLENEAKRIDENTKAPDDLAAIKTVFGADRQAYLDIYVLPQLAQNRLYYEVFVWDKTIHGASLSKVTALIEEAKKNPEGFKRIAEERGMTVSRLLISPERGVVRLDELERRSAAGASGTDIPGGGASSPEGTGEESSSKLSGSGTGEELVQDAGADHEARIVAQRFGLEMSTGSQELAKKVIAEVLNEAQPGEVIELPIEQQTYFQVLRLVASGADSGGSKRSAEPSGSGPGFDFLKEGEYVVESAIQQKRDYDEFFFEEAKRIRIEIRDEELKKKMVLRIPWTERLRIRDREGMTD